MFRDLKDTLCGRAICRNCAWWVAEEELPRDFGWCAEIQAESAVKTHHRDKENKHAPCVFTPAPLGERLCRWIEA